MARPKHIAKLLGEQDRYGTNRMPEEKGQRVRRLRRHENDQGQSRKASNAVSGVEEDAPLLPSPPLLLPSLLPFSVAPNSVFLRSDVHCERGLQDGIWCGEARRAGYAWVEHSSLVENVESTPKFTRCVRQDSVEAPTLWVKLAKHFL